MIYDPLDVELNTLVDKLSSIQKSIQYADTLSSLEKGAGGAVYDKFTDHQFKIQNRLTSTKTLAANIKELEAYNSKRSRELITLQAQLRSNMKQLEEEWQELDLVHKSETKKRRSKLSSRELADRQELILVFQADIEDMKLNMKLGFIQGKYMDSAPTAGGKVGSMAQSEMFLPSGTGTGTEKAGSSQSGSQGGPKEDVTDEQMQSLVEIRNRDTDIDKEIGIIGEGVDYLKHLATAMNEEVTLQNTALDRIQDKVERVNEKVSNVNERMKETLERARSGEKMIMDIICTVMLIGMCVVLYTVSRAQE